MIELLAAVCLVQGGHIKILQAVDNFKQANGEQYRFEKLVDHFMADSATPEFQVACMNFINVIVHSAEDLNFRVHLQHEFTLLGLDDFIVVCIYSCSVLLNGGLEVMSYRLKIVTEHGLHGRSFNVLSRHFNKCLIGL